MGSYGLGHHPLCDLGVLVRVCRNLDVCEVARFLVAMGPHVDPKTRRQLWTDACTRALEKSPPLGETNRRLADSLYQSFLMHRAVPFCRLAALSVIRSAAMIEDLEIAVHASREGPLYVPVRGSQRPPVADIHVRPPRMQGAKLHLKVRLDDPRLQIVELDDPNTLASMVKHLCRANLENLSRDFAAGDASMRFSSRLMRGVISRDAFDEESFPVSAWLPPRTSFDSAHVPSRGPVPPLSKKKEKNKPKPNHEVGETQSFRHAVFPPFFSRAFFPRFFPKLSPDMSPPSFFFSANPEEAVRQLADPENFEHVSCTGGKNFIPLETEATEVTCEGIANALLFALGPQFFQLVSQAHEESRQLRKGVRKGTCIMLRERGSAKSWRFALEDVDDDKFDRRRAMPITKDFLSFLKDNFAIYPAQKVEDQETKLNAIMGGQAEYKLFLSSNQLMSGVLETKQKAGEVPLLIKKGQDFSVQIRPLNSEFDQNTVGVLSWEFVNKRLKTRADLRDLGNLEGTLVSKDSTVSRAVEKEMASVSESTRGLSSHSKEILESVNNGSSMPSSSLLEKRVAPSALESSPARHISKASHERSPKKRKTNDGNSKSVHEASSNGETCPEIEAAVRLMTRGVQSQALEKRLSDAEAANAGLQKQVEELEAKCKKSKKAKAAIKERDEALKRAETAEKERDEAKAARKGLQKQVEELKKFNAEASDEIEEMQSTNAALAAQVMALQKALEEAEKCASSSAAPPPQEPATLDTGVVSVPDLEGSLTGHTQSPSDEQISEAIKALSISFASYDFKDKMDAVSAAPGLKGVLGRLSKGEVSDKEWLLLVYAFMMMCKRVKGHEGKFEKGYLKVDSSSIVMDDVDVSTERGGLLARLLVDVKALRDHLSWSANMMKVTSAFKDAEKAPQGSKTVLNVAKALHKLLHDKKV